MLGHVQPHYYAQAGLFVNGGAHFYLILADIGCGAVGGELRGVGIHET